MKVSYKHARVSDIIVYVLFGAIVTTFIKLVGVLLGFSYLGIPLFSGRLFYRDIKRKVIYGWDIDHWDL